MWYKCMTSEQLNLEVSHTQLYASLVWLVTLTQWELHVDRQCCSDMFQII
jgi:hypothetical protein